jgi:hypothetical protein
MTNSLLGTLRSIKSKIGKVLSSTYAETVCTDEVLTYSTGPMKRRFISLTPERRRRKM